MEKLSKAYNPKDVEDKIYKLWEKGDYFKPSGKGKPYTITIPPPNITGSLHMGHALNNTIQDILIRRARMKGFNTLWVPGTDHAGIATQNVVEKKLKKQGKTRHDLGREKFIKLVWEWKKEYGNTIIDQLKKLGCSCDWSRKRFTMDKKYSQAVNIAFEHYYKKGLIYKGIRVINWCPRCQTSLSDLEVEYRQQKGKFYYFRYDKNFPITIATTRPETKLGDTAVAVNPKDTRYKKYIGKIFDINLDGVKRKIQIISDKSIDAKFGTGALGVTPAHSIIDEEFGRKYSLDSIQIVDKFGKMTANAGKNYDGLKVLEARKKLVEYLKNSKLLEKEEKIDNNLSVCYRCGKSLQPQPSQQWFLKMGKLARPAIEVVKKGKIKFYPKRWKKVYIDWLENIHDWCISRQIWWGHRLPVWFCKNHPGRKSKLQITNYKLIGNSSAEKKYIISSKKPKQCPFCKKCQMEQSADVLDTWFSSALWPFAVLGWTGNAKKKSDLDVFYPTTTLSTARDIIYMWVARMVFSSLEFMGEIPFSEVYIHPTVFNKEGRRMSKSLGTGVDPLLLMDKYGTDATRFGLAYQNTGTQDIKFSEESILAGKKFANKIWNATRFILMNLEFPHSTGSGQAISNFQFQKIIKTKSDKKILNQLIKTIKLVDKYIDKYEFGQAAHTLYDFFWHDFCDKYLEQSKKQLNDKRYAISTKQILLYTLTLTLTLLHPFMPFITEEIWQKLPVKNKEKSIMVSKWPSPQKVNKS